MMKESAILNTRDDILEYVAQLIEESYGFVRQEDENAKRKRNREDAKLVNKTNRQARTDLADLVRRTKGERHFDAIEILKHIAEAIQHDRHPHYGDDSNLIRAWPLAWRGWLTISCVTKCNSNSVPPEAKYLIEITDKGRSALAKGA
jgi:hypothetical protein